MLAILLLLLLLIIIIIIHAFLYLRAVISSEAVVIRSRGVVESKRTSECELMYKNAVVKVVDLHY